MTFKNHLLLKKGGFAKTASLLISGNVLAHLISFFTTPIISRLYAPSDFGFNTIIISTSAIIVALVSLGMTSAIMISNDEKDFNQLVSVLFLLYFLLSIVFTIFFYLIFDLIFRIFLLDRPISWIFIFLVAVFSSFNSSLHVISNRQKKNKVLFWISFIGPVCTLLITIPLSFTLLKSFGLTIGILISYLIQIIYMINNSKLIITLPSFNDFFTVLIKFKNFLRFQYPANVLSNISQQFPNQLFQIFFGASSLGAISMTERLLGFPMRLIAAPMSTLYFRSINENKNNLKDFSLFTLRLIQFFLFIAFLPQFVTIIWGQVIFTFLLGSEWEFAGKIAGYFVFIYLLLFFQSITSYLKVSQGKQKENLLFTLFQIFMYLTPFLISAILRLQFETTIFIYTIFICSYLLIELFFNFHFLGHYKYSFLFSVFMYLFLIFITTNLMYFFTGQF